AIVELQSMSGEDRFNPQGFYNIANAQARLGDGEGAIKSYRKAIDQRKGRYSRASNNLGVVLMRLGRWDEAYEALMSALRQESFRYPEASYNLGRLYAARGEGDLAIREWRRAVTVDPEHAAATKALASAGSAETITVAARPSRSLSSNAPGGDASSRSGQPVVGTEIRATDNARPTSEKQTSLRPMPAGKGSFTVDPETYTFLQRGRAARDRGLNDAAVENYRRVITRMGGYFPPANLELSYVLIALKRNGEAAASLLPVTIRDGQRFPISYYHLARLHELGGELKLAEDYYRRAAESYGENNSQFLLDLTRVREKQGNLSGALASLEQYVSFVQRQGQKPEWSDQRLADLRLKVAASPTQPKQ
ncbi:MAG: tetratricopeptide repeat protein, partial [Pyrinomonadaceae bacterium]